MGDDWILWALPISGPSGDGLQWGIAEQRKSDSASASSAFPPEGTAASPP